ncbi:MAG: hypothetical protein ABSC60_16245 [Acidobacteriota bacterium]
MITEIIKRVVENLIAYRKRSIMTLVGITWGIASYILLIAYGDDFHRALLLGMKYFGDKRPDLDASGWSPGRSRGAHRAKRCGVHPAALHACEACQP